MSKNLVSGDFEKQYRDDIMTEKPRRRHMHLFLGVSVGALAIWMIVLTVVREVQITRLRFEVDELTANMIAVTANVKSLNQKLAENRLFNEINDDTVSHQLLNATLFNLKLPNYFVVNIFEIQHWETKVTKIKRCLHPYLLGCEIKSGFRHKTALLLFY